MKYKGKHNGKCPLCGKTTLEGHGVVYLYDRQFINGHLWCKECFRDLQTEYAGLKTERSIEAFLNRLHYMIFGCMPEQIPQDSMLGGFRFGPFTNQDRLGLVLNFREE